MIHILNIAASVWRWIDCEIKGHSEYRKIPTTKDPRTWEGKKSQTQKRKQKEGGKTLLIHQG